ncbi:MAG: DUF938 domain-containing protein [Oscillatoria sp. PMC 1068.18]|nr:DUF938 domain-containing protein [Oscillatoria sp. PMC 1076.18]MEC4988010.1 DUF938 domain-containing protein [Oscillatoria sp. PMC 1068.18]
MKEPLNSRQYAPATQRNREPILEILQQFLPSTGTILEIASGTGEHAAFFAPRLQPRQWIPSDPNFLARASINSWRQDCPGENLHPAIALDVRNSIWEVEKESLSQLLPNLDLQRHPIVAIVNINMIHISPWSTCLGLMAGARRILPPRGILYLYGPFQQNNQHTAQSNAEFDLSLKRENPEWGVRDLEKVVAVAQTEHLSLIKIIPMPANNLSVIFQAESQIS